jgi:enoyl-CoA hydratase/carnithine racemase
MALIQTNLNQDGRVAFVRLARPEKRNALSDALVLELKSVMLDLPESVKAVVLSGDGEHFCAGLDLAELKERDAAQGMMHSRMWHNCFDVIQFGRVPVVVALQGAVVGGGLELAAAAHIRVAADSAYFGLPEGQRGIFLGGGGSSRISKLIGFARVADMMLTGRVIDASEAERYGLVHYLTTTDQCLAHATKLAEKIAGNAPLSNFAIMHALPRIAEQSQAHGLLTESLISAIAQSAPDAKQRVQAFLSGRAEKVQKSS